ncbi:MAG: tetratricopeptide repeat protein [Terricaulis sp.]
MFGGRSKLDKGLDAFEKSEWKRSRKLLEEALQDEPRPSGFYHLGVMYWRGLGGVVDKNAAVEYFERGAEFGHPGAQTAYGIALRSGVGVAKNNEAAMRQFRSAAGGGDRESMVQIATMSEPDEARRWLMRAAELGYAPAMMHLSDFLMNRDPVAALSWLYAAVTLSAEDAARKRAAALAAEMSAKEIEEAQKIGREHAREIRDRTQGR